jgi:hypothetical protein
VSANNNLFYLLNLKNPVLLPFSDNCLMVMQFPLAVCLAANRVGVQVLAHTNICHQTGLGVISYHAATPPCWNSGGSPVFGL